MCSMRGDLDIHPTAVVSDTVVLGQKVKIGPYCVVDGNVKLGCGVKLHSHVCVVGNTEVGDNTEIFSFASIGSRPQDQKYCGEDSRVVIGKNNTIREYVTIQPGTAAGVMETIVGNDCLFMVGSHIAHDCIIGDKVILANNVALAGHVVLENNVIIGGLSGVHQFVRIGKYAMIGGMTAVRENVVPYSMVIGSKGSLEGVNVVGMKRAQFSRRDIDDITVAFRKIFFDHKMVVNDRLVSVMQEFSQSSVVVDVINFIKESNNRAICIPKDNKR